MIGNWGAKKATVPGKANMTCSGTENESIRSGRSQGLRNH